MSSNPKLIAQRVNDMLGKKALKMIQSESDNWMYYYVTEAALYMATAGFLEEANQLLANLWKHKWPHNPDCWLPDQAMEVLWFVSGNRPPDVPFEPKPIDTIELKHRAYMSLDNCMHLPRPAKDWKELSGYELFRVGCHCAEPRAEPDRLPSVDQEIEALRRFEKYLNSLNESDARFDPCIYDRATCLAAELAAKNGRTDQAICFLRLWAGEFPQWWNNYNLPALASNRHVAPLLLQGTLTDALGLSKETCRRHLKLLLAALEARMKQGRKLAYGKWTWQRLLSTLSKRAIKAGPDLFSKEERKAKWIGRGAASEEAIAATEQRLGLKLPADYLDFLRSSNGISAPSVVSPALLGVEEIDRLRNIVDADMLQILKDYPGDDFAAAMDTAIQISDKGPTGGEQQVFLIPPSTANDSWQTWFFAHWVPGEIRYPSFRHYLEQAYENLKSGDGGL